jgi:hypothetical protein
MSHLAIVPEGGPERDGFHDWISDRARRAMEQALLERPVAMLIIFETGDDPEPRVIRIPNSQALQDGLIAEVARLTMARDDAGDE